jgi:hypothetical protein
MRTLVLPALIASLLAMSPAFAQNVAYPTPDNSLTRSDDVDPSQAPYLNDEQGRPSSDDYAHAPDSDGIIIDRGSDGESSGESGVGPDEEAPPPDLPSPPR